MLTTLLNPTMNIEIATLANTSYSFVDTNNSDNNSEVSIAYANKLTERERKKAKKDKDRKFKAKHLKEYPDYHYVGEKTSPYRKLPNSRANYDQVCKKETLEKLWKDNDADIRKEFVGPYNTAQVEYDYSIFCDNMYEEWDSYINYLSETDAEPNLNNPYYQEYLLNLEGTMPVEKVNLYKAYPEEIYYGLVDLPEFHDFIESMQKKYPKRFE